MSFSTLARTAAAAVLLTCAGAACSTAPTALPTNSGPAPHPLMGVWQFEGYEGLEPRWLVVNARGGYVHAEVGPSDGQGHSGIEAGQLDGPNARGEVQVHVSVDTNGSWGLSAPQAAQWRWQLEGEAPSTQLRVQTPHHLQAEHLLRRLDTPAARAAAIAQGGITGAWQHPDGHVLILSSKRTWVMVDSTSGNAAAHTPTSRNPHCVRTAGVEYGSYTLQGPNMHIGLVFADTNGCAGLHDPAAPTKEVWGVTLLPDGRLQLQVQGKAPVVFSRL